MGLHISRNSIIFANFLGRTPAGTAFLPRTQREHRLYLPQSCPYLPQKHTLLVSPTYTIFNYFMDKKNLQTKLNSLLQGGIRLCLLTSVAFTVTACYAPAHPELATPQDWGDDTTQTGVPHRIAPRSAEEQIAEMQSLQTHNTTGTSNEVQP